MIINKPETDGDWVQRVLMPHLRRAGLRVAFSNSVSQPDVARVATPSRGLAQARRSLVILSESYLATRREELTTILAHQGGARPIFIKIEPLDESSLLPELDPDTILDLTEPDQPDLVRLLAALGIPEPAPQHSRAALLVGIDDYLIPQWRLKGCTNDQHLLRALLTERLGFREEDVRLLLNNHATRAAILDTLDHLAGMGRYEGAPLIAEGALVFIAFSGHGSRLREPPDQRDEADGYDATLVPCDSDRPRPIGLGGPNLDITDDEIFARVRRIKERASHLVMLFDCCHSGTILRDTEGGLARTMPDDDRYGDVERVSGFAEEGARGEGARGGSGFLPLDEGYLFMAGAVDTELAREYRDPETQETYGALTYHFVREVMRQRGPLTYRDIFQRVQAQVSSRYPSQHPQLEGDWNRRFFDLEELPEPPPILVQSRLNEHRVLLSAGVAQGLKLGTSWQLFTPSGRPAESLATVTIRALGPVTSEAVSDTPLPPEVQVGFRAVEFSTLTPDFRVPVAVVGMDEGEVNKLRELIRGSSLLMLTEEEPADLLTLLLPPRSEANISKAQGALYAPELGPLTTPTWVIVGRDRAMLPLPPHSTDEADAAEATFSNLEMWARYLNVQQIRPIGADPLRGKIKVTVQRRSVTGALEEFPIHEVTGLPLIREGDVVRIWLENILDRPLYLALLGLDVVGNITWLSPPAHMEEPLGPYQIHALENTCSLPATFPAALPGGRESLKFLVTTRYVDFAALEQEGAVGEEGTGVTVWYAGAMLGGGPRRIDPLTDTIDEDSWTVEQFDYFMARGSKAPARTRAQAIERLGLVRDDLLELTVDAIVHPTGPEFGFDGLVGKQLRQRLGDEFVATLQRRPRLKPGETVWSENTELHTRRILHVPMRDDLGLATPTSMNLAVTSALQAAEAENLRTIAFPAIGTGAAGFASGEVAQPQLLAMLRHLEGGSLETILVALVEEETFAAYARAYEALGGRVEAEWLPRLTEAAQQVLAIADGIRRAGAARLVEPAHLLGALYLGDRADPGVLTSLDSGQYLDAGLRLSQERDTQILLTTLIPEMSRHLQELLPTLGSLPLPAPLSFDSTYLSMDSREVMACAVAWADKKDDGVLRPRHILWGLVTVSRNPMADWLSRFTGHSTEILQAFLEQLPEEGAVTADWIRETLRYLEHTDFVLDLGLEPHEIPLGGHAHLSVGLRPAPPDATAALIRRLPRAVTQLYCRVKADGAQVTPTDAMLEVSAEGQEGVPARFTLEGHLVGPCRYEIELVVPELVRTGVKPIIWDSDSTEAMPRLTVSVPAPEEERPPILPTLDIQVAPQPDWVLEVSASPDRAQYALHYRLTSTLALYRCQGEAVGDVILTNDDLTRLRTLVTHEVGRWGDLPPADNLAHLHALGSRLWALLFPPATTARFHERFWEAAGAIRSWLIVEDGMQRERTPWIPWELVAPYRPDQPEVPRFLWGERYRLAHWVGGTEAPALYPEVPRGDLSFDHYLPTDKVGEAVNLATLLRAEFHGLQALVGAETTVYGLHLLQRTDRQSEYGVTPRAAAPQTTPMNGTEGEVREGVQRTQLDLRRKRPLVTSSFLRQVERPIPPELWALAERAQTFLRVGASAVVGPWWPTSDEADRLFWATFYTRVKAREPLGEAVWQARHAVRRRFPSRSDWLAYALFGDPRARAYRPRPSEGYAGLELLNPDSPLRANKPYRVRVTFQSEPPLAYREQLVITKALPRQLEASIIAPYATLSTMEPVMMQQVGQNLLKAEVTITFPRPGNYRILANLLDGNDALKTLRLMVKIIG